VDLYGDAAQLNSRETVYIEPTYGQWRKVGAHLQAGLTQDGQVGLVLGNLQGLFEVDGLQVLPISDRQGEALRTFIDGADPQ
jgi:hypothetical protein